MTVEYVDVGGVRLAFERAGHGYPVLLIHSMLEESQLYWEEWRSAGGKVQRPVWVLWAARGPVVGALVFELWQTVAEDVDGIASDKTAHYFQEERSEEVARRILGFAERRSVG